MVDGFAFTATFAAEKEAEAWLAVTRGSALWVRAARRLTLEAYARQWLGEFVDDAADLDRYRPDVECYVIPGLGGQLLLMVTADGIGVWQQARPVGFADVVVACDPTGHRWRVVAEQCDVLGLERVCAAAAGESRA